MDKHDPNIHGWLKQVVERQLQLPDSGLVAFSGARSKVVTDDTIFSEGTASRDIC